MEPKYHEESRLYWRSTALDPNPWEPGLLCVMPSEVIAAMQDLPDTKRVCDMQSVLIGIARVEQQVFDMMGGMNGY